MMGITRLEKVRDDDRASVEQKGLRETRADGGGGNMGYLPAGMQMQGADEPTDKIEGECGRRDATPRTG